MLTARAAGAARWGGAEMAIRYSLMFFFSVILARILQPEDFGLVAVTLFFASVAAAIVDGGFSSALIQRQNVTSVDESTVFWICLGIGAVCAGLLWASKVPIADYFGDRRLVPLIEIMAWTVAISSFGVVQAALLTKRLAFKLQMMVGVLAVVVGGAVAIGLAYSGWGAQALAIQALVSAVVTTAGLWLFFDWRPKVKFSFSSARRLFAFGGFMFASSILDVAYNRLYSVVVGRLFGFEAVGFFSRAESTAQLPVNALNGVVSRVTFSAFSQVQETSVRLRSGMKKASEMAMLVHAPIMIGLSAAADPLVRTIYGDKWAPAAPVLQVLSLAAVLMPMHVINLSALKAQGYSSLFFRLELVKKTIGVVIVIGASHFGMLGLAWGLFAYSIIALSINTRYSKRHLDYGLLAQLKDVAPAIICAAAMGILVHSIDQWLVAPVPIVAISLVVLGAVAYCILAALFLRDSVSHLRDALTPK